MFFLALPKVHVSQGNVAALLAHVTPSLSSLSFLTLAKNERLGVLANTQGHPKHLCRMKKEKAMRVSWSRSTTMLPAPVSQAPGGPHASDTLKSAQSVHLVYGLRSLSSARGWLT